MSAITCSVTQEDIDNGESGDCYRCAVALAMARATGDDGANVHEHEWELRLEVEGCSIPAPDRVRAFVRAFDEPGRGGDPSAIKPFSFQIPAINSPLWERYCDQCHTAYDRDELDESDLCDYCRDEA